MNWNIQMEGRAWTGQEVEARMELRPEKLEIYYGKLFWTAADRLNMLAMLLENVGVAKAVELGKPEVWKAAVSNL